MYGLTTKEAQKRIDEYGKNTIEKKEEISPLKLFLSQFNDVITSILIIATIISFFMGEVYDAITILIIIIMNGVLGFIQEYRTEKSLEALKKLASPTAKILRDGSVKVINAEDVTVGDIMVLETGDRVPADAKLIEEIGIIVDESLLTGESIGVEKNLSDNNKVFMGTIITSGRGYAEVISVGMKTEMGKIAHLIQNVEEERSPIKVRLDHLGKILVFLCIGVCVVVTITGVLRGQNVYEMFLLGVSLAVAAIPEGLPAIVTVSLALGVSRMLKRNALVKKLPAVETLGCTSIICSDKTGTLTENKMRAKVIYYNRKIFELDKESPPQNQYLKNIFTYCQNLNIDHDIPELTNSLSGDSTEKALINIYLNKTSELTNFLNNSSRLKEIPFNSKRKMMSVIVSHNNKRYMYLKGAPEKVLEKCNFILDSGEPRLFTDTFKAEVLKTIESLSYKALRCIAGAYKEISGSVDLAVENNFVFAGLAAIMDPPRKEVKAAISKCSRAGITPVMITGDHKNTAFAIARELGIVKDEKEVLTGEELEKIDDGKISKSIKDIKVFARVTPEHKLKIVKTFKKLNNVVAMTGDGVNDAPALKESDIGIAMGIAGTDVTKEVASMILLDDNYNSIVSAVEEGRIIYKNIRKFIRYLLSCNLGEVLTMFLASILNLDIPLLSIQILLVNLATDGLPALALGVDNYHGDVMKEKPREKNESIFSHGLSEKIILRGTLIGVCTILSFIAANFYGLSIEKTRTIALSTLIISQLIHVFECRSEEKSIFEINPFSNIKLILAVITSLLLLVSIIYIPFLQGIFKTEAIIFSQWLIVIFFSGIITFLNSLFIFFRNRR